MIKEITNEVFLAFLKKNKATSKQVSINIKGRHYGYFIDDNIVGCISFFDLNNVRRIKGLLVNEDYQRKGIAFELLEHVSHYKMTAFATSKSKNIFLKKGFKIHNELKNNITFLKYDITSL